jgi:hypothetical protein
MIINNKLLILPLSKRDAITVVFSVGIILGEKKEIANFCSTTGGFIMDLEKKIVQELSGDEAFRHIQKISAEIPARSAGTEESKQMAEYLRDHMISYGIPAEIHEFDALARPS